MGVVYFLHCIIENSNPNDTLRSMYSKLSRVRILYNVYSFLPTEESLCKQTLPFEIQWEGLFTKTFLSWKKTVKIVKNSNSAAVTIICFDLAHV